MPAHDLAYRERITKSYKIAVCCYAAPVGFLALSTVFSFFFPLFLLGFFPLGAASTAYSIAGLKLAFKNNDHQKKDIGYANLLLGIIMVTVGTLLVALVYLSLN